jgi:hypothetical protein
MSKRLIFTITTGRSGTMYLGHLLSGLPNIRAEHEPEPYFHALLPQVRRDPAIARRFLQEVKLPFIEKLPEKTYFETSHYFGKGFLEPMLELGRVPDLILFSRNARKVASSFFLIGTARKRLFGQEKARTHMLLPDEPNFLPARNWEEWHEYQLYYWYALETLARAEHYKKLIIACGGKVFQTTLERLKAGNDYKELLAWMGVKEEVATARLADKAFFEQVLNDKAASKRRKGREGELTKLDLDRLEAGVRGDCGLKEAI